MKNALLFALLLPITASAGSWPIRCELEKDKLTFAAEHFNPKKRGTEYDAVPMEVEIWVGPEGKPEKLKTKKRVGPVWIFTFPSATVVYTGVDTPDTVKHGVFLKPDGTWIGESVCK